MARGTILALDKVSFNSWRVIDSPDEYIPVGNLCLKLHFYVLQQSNIET